MNLPGFTAEDSIYKTSGRYGMTTTFDSQNASANVQPAIPQGYCTAFRYARLAAQERGDDGWYAFWDGAYWGCMGQREYPPHM
jgi:hypothetical protein